MDPLFGIFRRHWSVLSEIIYTLFILGGAWAATKVFDRILRRFLKAPAEDNAHLKNYVLRALRLPIIYLIFLIGSYTALHRLPLGPRPYPYLDGILFVLGVVIILSLILQTLSALLHWYQRRIQARGDGHLELEFIPLIDRLIMVLVFMIGVGVILDHFHIDIKSLLVTLGVGSLAIGLALQDTLANMFGGFTIMLDRPFRMGDFIELTTGESGHVINIGMRSTQLRNADNNVLSIPNALLVKNMIINHSYPDTRIVIKVKLTVERGTDIARVRELMRQAVLSVEEVLRDPAPDVFFTEFTDSGLTLQVQAAIKDYRVKLTALDKVNQRIYAALQEAHVPLAAPMRMVYVKSDSGKDHPPA